MQGMKKKKMKKRKTTSLASPKSGNQADSRKTMTSHTELSKEAMTLKSHHLGVGKTHMLKATQDERPYRVYTLPICCCALLWVFIILNFSL